MQKLLWPLPCLVLALTAAARADIVASYEFQNTLASSYGTAPALTAVNPFGTNNYQTQVAFGQPRTVYRMNGAPNSTQNTGLILDTTGLVLPTIYSVEIVFRLDSTSGYRKLMDFTDRGSDNGLYSMPGNGPLQLFPPSGAVGSTPVAANTFYHVTLTNAAMSPVRVYLNGVQQIAVGASTANLNNNSGDLLRFLMDDLVTTGNEHTSSYVALIRVYDHVLTPTEVSQRASNPFAIIPEAGGWALLAAVTGGVGLAAGVRSALRRARKSLAA